MALRLRLPFPEAVQQHMMARWPLCIYVSVCGKVLQEQFSLHCAEDGGEWWHQAVIINCAFLMATALGSIPANCHFQVERACSPNALHIPVLGTE
jgi:hypothetical protein